MIQPSLWLSVSFPRTIDKSNRERFRIERHFGAADFMAVLIQDPPSRKGPCRSTASSLSSARRLSGRPCPSCGRSLRQPDETRCREAARCHRQLMAATASLILDHIAALEGDRRRHGGRRGRLTAPAASSVQPACHRCSASHRTCCRKSSFRAVRTRNRVGIARHVWILVSRFLNRRSRCSNGEAYPQCGSWREPHSPPTLCDSSSRPQVEHAHADPQWRLDQ